MASHPSSLQVVNRYQPVEVRSLRRRRDGTGRCTLDFGWFSVRLELLAFGDRPEEPLFDLPHTVRVPAQVFEAIDNAICHQWARAAR